MRFVVDNPKWCRSAWCSISTESRLFRALGLFDLSTNDLKPARKCRAPRRYLQQSIGHWSLFASLTCPYAPLTCAGELFRLTDCFGLCAVTFPSPHPYGVLALSGHWIAYAARELPDGATEVVGSDAVSAVGAMGKSLSMVEMLGSTLSVWSGSLVGSAAPPVDEPMLKEGYMAGIVMVMDAQSGSTLAQFKAHGSALSSMAFDRTGTLLATASVEGHSIRVFQVAPISTSSPLSNFQPCPAPSPSHQHLPFRPCSDSKPNFS